MEYDIHRRNNKIRIKRRNVLILSEKNKELWIEDYLKEVNTLSMQEIKSLETSWASDKSENYFRTDAEKLNLWLIDTYNYDNLTVEMQVDIDVTSKEDGCEIGIKPQKFKLHYLRMVIFFYIILLILFCIISQSAILLAFGVFQAVVLYLQKRIIYKNTKNRIIDKIQDMG